MMLLIVGFLFMVFIFTIVSLLTGARAAFIDFPSALLIIVTLLFFFFSTKSGKTFGKYIKASFRKEHIYTANELTSLCIAAKNTIKFTLWVGGFGFFAGVIAALFYLDDPNMLGPNLAVSLITFMYSITISCFVFFPVQAWAENKINTLKEARTDA
jgi:flagellar motor component MotA